jgi:hypothetical protein
MSKLEYIGTQELTTSNESQPEESPSARFVRYRATWWKFYIRLRR